MMVVDKGGYQGCEKSTAEASNVPRVLDPGTLNQNPRWGGWALGWELPFPLWVFRSDDELTD
jgi:hypothetical protein